MKKIGVLLILLFFISFISFVDAEEESTVLENIGEGVEKVGEGAKNIDKYAETVGEWILRFQEFLLGVLTFLSFGVFGQGGTFAFAQFLFMILVFMVIYSVAGFIPVFSGKFKFPISLIITILAFLVIDTEEIQLMLLTYESMGVTITVVLPVLILLAFTFRIYQKAYEGEGNSPFYAEMFNLIFLVFFGIFFIRHSVSEEGIIASARFISGWVLIGMGLAQTILYKILAGLFHQWKKNSYKLKADIGKAKKEFLEKMQKEDVKDAMS